MIPNLQTLLTVGAYVGALTVIAAPVAYLVRMEFSIKALKRDVSGLQTSVQTLDGKIDNLLIQAAGWFAVPRRRMAGRGKSQALVSRDT